MMEKTYEFQMFRTPPPDVSSENAYQPPSFFSKLVRKMADLPRFLIFITLAQFGFFIYYSASNPDNPAPKNSYFIFRSYKQEEIWRFLTYMMMNSSWLHLGFNLVVQMLVGLPLEMVHGSRRVGLIYMSGVVAGSLGFSVFDTGCYLVGASGGLYALLAAHLADIFLNYKTMGFGNFKLIGIIAIASCDVGFAIYSRGEEFKGTAVSYVVNLNSALAGLTIGLSVLKIFEQNPVLTIGLIVQNFNRKLYKRWLRWVALGVYVTCTISAIGYNLSIENSRTLNCTL